MLSDAHVAVMHVERWPALFCRIYDRRGTAEGEVETVYAVAVAKKTQGPVAARKKIVNGLLMLAVSVACVWVDWRLGGPVILGVLVGAKFLTTGIMRLVEGFSGLMEAQTK